MRASARGLASRALLLCALVPLCHCTEPARRGQLRVRIDADAAVRAQVAQVDALIEVQDSQGSWETVRMVRFRPNEEHPWPLRLNLTLDDRRSNIAYQLTATAKDSHGAILLRSQATRDSEPGRNLTLEVSFESACIDRLCGESMTCSAGECVGSDEPLDPKPTSPDGDASVPPDGMAPTNPRSTAGVQRTGSPCSEAGARSCSGRASRQPLSCDGTRWNEEPVCAESERCDASNGPERGTCRPIARECVGHEPNEQFCDGDTMRICLDLVVAEPRLCSDHERCVDIEGKAICGCVLGFVDKGTGCQPATDCQTDNGGCDSLTKCSVANGERSCSACPPGHSGKGATGCAPLLQALELSHGKLEPALAAAGFDYRIEVPLVAQRVVLTPRGPNGSRIAIEGEALAADGRWTSPPLALGDNAFELHLWSASEVRSIYRLTIARSGGEEAFVKASNAGEYDQFGMTVALSGDTLAVGAVYEDSAATGIGGDQSSNAAADSGAVYVYVREADGWQQQAYLKASEVARDDFFGRAVAVSGDTLAVGAIRDADSTSAAARSGVVYVFERSAGTWQQTARLTSSSPSAADQFGVSLALAGDRLVVGAANAGSRREGAAFVFERSATGWSEGTRLAARTPSPASQFGFAVALHGDRIAVGAPEDGMPVARGGSATVFVREGGGWVEQKRLLPALPSEGATFGFSVAVHGERVAVGAPRGVRIPDFGPHPPGEAYTFASEAGEWRQVAVIQAPRPAQDDFFGISVALDEGALLVGANGEASGGRGLNADVSRSDARYAGAAFLFSWVKDAWVRTAYLKSSNAGTDHGFGYALALDGERIAVGALFEPSDAARERRLMNAGAAYVFH